MFERDISNLAKPEIKGRGFLGTGKDIIETQTYYTKPENQKIPVVLYKPIELLEQYYIYEPKALQATT